MIWIAALLLAVALGVAAGLTVGALMDRWSARSKEILRRRQARRDGYPDGGAAAADMTGSWPAGRVGEADRGE